MCRRIDRQKCGRPTYAGCGAHVEQVLVNVPGPDRCHCKEAALKTSDSEAKREQARARK